MNIVGQPERATQNRVIAQFCDELGYRYLGDWADRIQEEGELCRKTKRRGLIGTKTPSDPKQPTQAPNHQPVGVVTKSCYKAPMATHRILVHVSQNQHRVLDPDDVCAPPSQN